MEGNLPGWGALHSTGRAEQCGDEELSLLCLSSPQEEAKRRMKVVGAVMMIAVAAVALLAVSASVPAAKPVSMAAKHSSYQVWKLDPFWGRRRGRR